MSRRGRSRTWQIWRWPVVLAMSIVFGLVSALLGEGGLWWALSWMALTLPLVVILVGILRRRRPAGEKLGVNHR